jgi:carbamoyl-phosphate synthase small subunit
MSIAKKTPATLALSDGKLFHGYAFGAHASSDSPCIGEVVFNTSMYGYQEILSDPSYAGQIMTFTYPHIGNVGTNGEDEESKKVHIEGLVIRDLSKVASNFRSVKTLDAHLKENNKMGIYGVDTRELVVHLRTHGAQMGAIAAGEGLSSDLLVDFAKKNGSMLGKDYVSHVSCKSSYSWHELPWQLGVGTVKTDAASEAKLPHVVALDCGIKWNILRLLRGAGLRVTVLPAFSTAAEIQAQKPDGLFLSNGPGDPATLGSIVDVVKSFVGVVPIFGICLGDQILSQAIGGKTYKLKFGHRGGNHPVKDLKTGKIEITVQNHGFAVDPKSLPDFAFPRFINLNDGTIEGIDIEDKKAFSIQYHPESSPGPHDALHHFNRFRDLVVGV